MNYRHAFHAGNFADVMKHALLARILLYLTRKEAPFRFVDTHAGIGLYDLGGLEASRTGEWRDGIGRLATPLPEPAEALLIPYRQCLEEIRSRFGAAHYPGSPLVAGHMLRPDDRAVLVERHRVDARLLADRFRRVRNAKVLEMDGWTGLGSLIPPRERRGLVLVDPPYEERGELARAVERLARAHRRWPTGILALWYPVKRTGDVDETLRAFADEPGAASASALRLELRLEPPDDLKLTGSGLLVVNPPWTLAGDAAVLLGALADRLGRRDPEVVIDHIVRDLTPLRTDAQP